jgi:hypothetical protein
LEQAVMTLVSGTIIFQVEEFTYGVVTKGWSSSWCSPIAWSICCLSYPSTNTNVERQIRQ